MYPHYSQELIDKMADAVGADMSSCIMAMFEINKNPEIRKRKDILYRGKELQALGFRKVEKLPDGMRRGYERMINENLYHATWSPAKAVGSPDGIASY